jgi:hypothetical protein
MNRDLPGSIFSINNPGQFREAALQIFNFQAEKNSVYRDYISFLGRNALEIKAICSIPFLPVELFRTNRIITGDKPAETVFESSSTTGNVPTRHYISDPGLYETSFLRSFRIFVGEPSDYLIAALLPSYLERSTSSLVYMMDRLIRETGDPGSGFYRNETGKLLRMLAGARKGNRKLLLLGVSFALLDLAEEFSPDLSGITVMETGGMKGRRKEITRQELHMILKERFNVPAIRSEYGMTELLSQAYSESDGVFHAPPWMKVLIRDPQDPLSCTDEPGITGGINIIDLANYYSCSFLATGDLGRLHEDGGFEVIGRFDDSEIRGCNLMAE